MSTWRQKHLALAITIGLVEEIHQRLRQRQPRGTTRLCLLQHELGEPGTPSIMTSNLVAANPARIGIAAGLRWVADISGQNDVAQLLAGLQFLCRRLLQEVPQCTRGWVSSLAQESTKHQVWAFHVESWGPMAENGKMPILNHLSEKDGKALKTTLQRRPR